MELEYLDAFKSLLGKVYYLRNINFEVFKPVLMLIDWEKSITDGRSIAGYCSYVWGNLVTWQSKKQNVAVRSTTKAEFRVVANGLLELIWLQRVMRDMKLKIEASIKLYYDTILEDL